MTKVEMVALAILGVTMLLVGGISLFKYFTGPVEPRTKETQDADEQGFGL